MSKIISVVFFIACLSQLQASDLGYVDISKIHPGQVRYSRFRVDQKVAEAIKNGSVIFSEKRATLKYDGGKSLIPLKKSLPVILGPNGYVLVDGHHDMILSLNFYAKTIPVKQIADLSHMGILDFWEKSEELGFAHLKSLGGEKRIPPDNFFDLEDDPMRYFATITARKYSPDLSQSTGAEYPLWIKIGKDIPFIEFYISDVLRKEGIQYEYSMGNHPADELIERARMVLLKAKIPGLKVLDQRLHYTELKLLPFFQKETFEVF